MKKRELKRRTAETARLFHKWAEIVAACRRGEARVSAAQYSKLHERLVENCQKLVQSADANATQQWHEVSNVVGPWLSLESLAEANSRVLVRLLDSCRLIKHRLGGHLAFTHSRALLFFAALGAVTVVVVALFLLSESLSVAEIYEDLRLEIARRAYRFSSYTTTWGLIALATLLLVCGGMLGLRGTKQY